MKKSTLFLLGVISILTSCSVTKEVTTEPVVSEQEVVQVNTTVILPGQVDTIPFNVGDTALYNTYRESMLQQVIIKRYLTVLILTCGLSRIQLKLKLLILFNTEFIGMN